MTTFELVTELHLLGVVLELSGEGIRVDAPRGAITPTLLEQLTASKPALLRLLDQNGWQVTWRAAAMLGQIPDSGRLPTLLVAREAVEPERCECISCGEALRTEEAGLCEYCSLAQGLAVTIFQDEHPNQLIVC